MRSILVALLQIELTLMCLLVFSIKVVAAENSFEVFHEANQSFENGQYEVALAKYASLKADGFDSSDIEYNLGNCYFKDGNLGHSIFHYRRALEFSPRDADIKFNLNFAREKVTDQVENREGLWGRVKPLFESVSEKEAYYFLAGVMGVLFAICIFDLYKKLEIVQWIRNVLILCLLLGISVIGYDSVWRETYGVIVVPESKVYSGVGKDNVVLFALHEGVELSVVETAGSEWTRIRLIDGKQGWVKSDNIETN